MRRRRKGLDLFLYLAARVIVTLPAPLVKRVLKVVCYLIVMSNLRLKKTIFHNLSFLFPQKGLLKKRRLAQKIIFNAAWNIYRNNRLHRGNWAKKLTRVEGRENLENAWEKRKGVICLSAHLGNFGVLLSYLSCNYPVKTITNDSTNPYFARHVRKIRELSGIVGIPRRPIFHSVKESLRWLQAGNILFILADEYRRKGVLVPFFGIPVGTQTAPAAFARRLGSPVVPVTIGKRGEEYIIRIEPELKLVYSHNYQEDIKRNTELFNRVIERWIKEDPEEWLGWMNRRFLAPKRRRDEKKTEESR